MRKNPHKTPVALFLHDLGSGAGDPAPSLSGPPVDIVDDGQSWRMVFEIPGSVPERLELEVHGRIVHLSGERRATEGEPGQFLRVERVSGPFERVLELPDDPDPEKTRAHYADGLLVVTIPRLAHHTSRNIPIQRAEAKRGRS